jgi:cephalosporin hydroxylase
MHDEDIPRMAADADLQRSAKELFVRSCEYRYSYHFTWMGRPIIQYPQDMVAMQEIIWSVRPSLVIETGVAHGGSLVFYASLLELIGGDSYVLGIDIDIRAHNRTAIEAHPMSKRIQMIQGSSIDPAVVAQVAQHARGQRSVIVILDSNHSHSHVLSELEQYSGFVTKGSYLVVFDTVIDDMPKRLMPDRPWGPGDNPKTAVREFLTNNSRFAIDHETENKLLLTVAPNGYLRCLSD